MDVTRDAWLVASVHRSRPRQGVAILSGDVWMAGRPEVSPARHVVVSEMISQFIYLYIPGPPVGVNHGHPESQPRG